MTRGERQLYVALISVEHFCLCHATCLVSVVDASSLYKSESSPEEEEANSTAALPRWKQLEQSRSPPTQPRLSERKESERESSKRRSSHAIGALTSMREKR